MPAAAQQQKLQAAQFAGFPPAAAAGAGQPRRTGRGDGRRARTAYDQAHQGRRHCAMRWCWPRRDIRDASPRRHNVCCARPSPAPNCSHRASVASRGGVAAHGRGTAAGGRKSRLIDRDAARAGASAHRRPRPPSPGGCRQSRRRPRNCARQLEEAKAKLDAIAESSAASADRPPANEGRTP